MEYKEEKKIHSTGSVSATCQNCKNSFVIEKEDFNFYEKIKVPPPTFCPECRLIRRMAWRNERALFHTNCDSCKKRIFSAYPSERPYPVFCHDCWFGDAWDPMEYGKEYDFSKTFFAQFKELFDKVPRLNLFHVNPINSQYSNITRDCKNVYLSYSIVEGEDVYYPKNVDRSRQIYDSLTLTDCEKSAHIVYGMNSYNTFYSVIIRDCIDSMFLFDCKNCSHCFMSANLRNQQYVFRGQKYSKEKYQSLINEINIGSYKELQKLVVEFEKMKLEAIHKYADIIQGVKSTGDALVNVKDAKECFESYDMENVKWVSRSFSLRDAYDCNYSGLHSEIVYEYISGGKGQMRVFFSVAATNPLQDSYYTGWCGGSNLFGCFGVRDKSYCILNKQYEKVEYEKILSKIIEQMKTLPYEGKNGRRYGFGEFFPIELSPFAYNESLAHEFSPLPEQKVKEKGYIWKESEKKDYKITIKSSDLPDNVSEVGNNVLKEIIGCEHEGKCSHQCTKAFIIHPEELAYYRNTGLPLPRLCPNCRYYKRLEYRKPWKLWHRSCMCDKKGHFHGEKHCEVEFETSYAPDRPEIVYCERCYQQEVY